MPSQSYSATIGVPAETVWELLVGIESWPQWLHVPYASESVTVVSAGPIAEGTEFILRGRLSFRLFARVTQLEEMRLFAFEIHRSEYPSDRLFFKRASIALKLGEANDGETRVTCTHWIEGKGRLGQLYMATAFRPFLIFNVRRIVRSLAQSA